MLEVSLERPFVSESRSETDTRWLRAFHAGDREVLEACYRAHFEKVAAAATRILRSVDAETVTHEVFYRLLSDPKMRESFGGGSVAAWLKTIAERAALDQLRRLRREQAPIDDDFAVASPGEIDPRRADDEIEAKMLVERFRREVLPQKYQALFEVRFLRQLPQRDAARELGIQRSTLAYQEERVRELLEGFLLDGADR